MGNWRAQLVFTVIICTTIIYSVYPPESAYATTTTLSNQDSCNSLGGVWTDPPPTCTFSSQLTIATGDTLIINSGITLKIDPDNNLINKGSITNNGIITLSGNTVNNRGNLVNRDSSSFTNSGTVNIIGGSGNDSGVLTNRDMASFTNSGTINITGGAGKDSGRLAITSNSVFSNLDTIIIKGDSGEGSGYVGATKFGKLTNSGTLTITGGSGKSSGQIDNWNDATITNTGSITINGSTGKFSGQLLNMGNTVFTNLGIITINGGGGSETGRLVNSENGEFKNHNTISITAGVGINNIPLVLKENSHFSNSGTITSVNNLVNSAIMINCGTVSIGNNVNNINGFLQNGGVLTFSGSFIGNTPIKQGCNVQVEGSDSEYEDPTIGKSLSGKQIVENGICINIRCWTVTAAYHQDFELVELLSDSTNTISTTVFCQRGVSKCNYVAFGVSPYGTNINDSIWKIILQKDHLGKWTMTVFDPEGYLGEVTSTTQIVNDGKHLTVSATIEFKKPTSGKVLNVELRDSGGGYRDFKFNDGVAIKDAYAYPSIPTFYEESLQIKPICLNENPNKRYTCAFDLVKEWTIKNAQSTLQKIINK